MSVSRLQLAAALLEYDNDPSDTTRPRQSHRDSAIFAPIKAAEANGRRRKILSQPPPLLPSPVESTFSARTESFPRPRPQTQYQNQDWRRSTSEFISQAGQPREEETEDLADVDVARWGLPEHLVVTTPRPVSTRRVTLSQIVPESAVQRRVNSIHVADVLEDEDWDHRHDRDGLSIHTDAQAQRAIAEAERIRRLVEGRPQTVMSYNGTTTNPIMVPLPTSPSPRTSMSTRPLSSLRALSPQQWPDDDDQMPNPFALPAPPPELGSRFDPKALLAQRRSSVSSLSRPMSMNFNLDSKSEMGLDQGHDMRSESLGLSAQREPISTPPVVYDEIPTPEQYGRPLMPKRYTAPTFKTNRQSLLPKVLVMPAPLAGSEKVKPERMLPEGFTLGEKPLPADARTSGNRPGLPLSLSQKTFRSSLLVDGQRDEYFVGGAEEDGEIGLSRRELADDAIERKPGKLYGRSLMDELEARKAALKGKQRQFQGDSRPAMMARSGYDHSPSLSPVSPNTYSAQPLHNDRTLLRVVSNGNIPANTNDRLTKSKSVFGVDTLWEKEIAKLKIMQEEEKLQLERRQREEAEKAAISRKKGKKKANQSLNEGGSITPMEDRNFSSINHTLELPPALEYTQDKIPAEELPHVTGDSTGDTGLGVGEWFESSDEEQHKQDLKSEDDSSDDEPLSKLAKSPIHVPPLAEAEPESESDEEDAIPLSKIARHRPTSTAMEEAEDEDDLPLAVRRANVKGIEPPTRAEIIEDDLPLGYKHAEAAQRQMQMQYVPPLQMGMEMGMGMPIYGQSMYMPQFGYPNPNFDRSMSFYQPQLYQQYQMPIGMGMGVQSNGMDQGMGPGPGSNIDSWRKEVPLASGGSGSSHS